jgi:hypothetical protein
MVTHGPVGLVSPSHTPGIILDRRFPGCALCNHTQGFDGVTSLKSLVHRMI